MNGGRLLLTGAGGQLGRALRDALEPRWDVTALTRAELDVTDPHSVARAMRDVRPDVIVNAAAYTAVDAAERDRDAAWAANAVAPATLAHAAARAGAALVHYSTDYVFDGAARVPHRENDAPAPLGAYGASKLAGERAVAASGARAAVLRTAWLYAPQARNFFGTMVRLATNSVGPVRVVNDRWGTPTSCAFVAEATAAMLGRLTEWPAGATTYHVTASGATTWHGFAEAIFAGLAARGLFVAPLEAITSAEYPTPAPRPAYSVLDTTRVTRTFGVTPTPWRAQLDRVLDAHCAATPATSPTA